jgi:hypothetical protein
VVSTFISAVFDGAASGTDRSLVHKDAASGEFQMLLQHLRLGCPWVPRALCHAEP